MVDKEVAHLANKRTRRAEGMDQKGVSKNRGSGAERAGDAAAQSEPSTDFSGSRRKEGAAEGISNDIGVFSEVGRLRKVLVHTPGAEVERMSPETASELLFNEIIHYAHVKRSHGELKAILSQVCDVVEVKDFVEEILQFDEVKLSLLKDVLALGRCEDLMAEVLRFDPGELAKVLVTGLPLKRNTLERYLSSGHFSLLPLPNMYFMRDSSMVVGLRNIVATMASPVRAAESVIMKALFQHHPRLSGKGILLDGRAHATSPDFRIEGGDVLVYSEDILLVGVSERTSAQAVDALIDRLIQTRRQDGIKREFSVFTVVLPEERSTIHLDMIFTLVDRNAAVVYEPYVMGRRRSRTVQVDVSATGAKSFKEAEHLLAGLKRKGIEIEPIVCGGGDLLHQQREQWNSGANLFAFAPGQVICYEMHEHTVRACEDAGFRIFSARDVIEDGELLRTDERLVVTMDGSELARGGGGPRCMTCPVLRDPV
jgi:arginine deiminase